ncbi:MAG: hypothetical protein GY803_16530 [Chloroflexi bacterium]|nr:hypothetical protein [Chloroflexota bacterium]
MTERKTQLQTKLKASFLQAMVEAALEGHDLGGWQGLDDRGWHYQAVCRQCRQPTLVSTTTVHPIPGYCPINP